MARLPMRDYLYQIQHPTIKSKVMTFEPLGNTFDSDVSRPGSTYVVPGANGPIDNFGDAANPMGSRSYSFRFIKPYEVYEDGTRETYTHATDEFRRMVVHGKRFTAVKKTVEGELRYARFKLTGLKDGSNPDDAVAATFEATFDMNPPYWYHLHREGIPIFNEVGWIFNVGGHIFNDPADFGFILNQTRQTIHIDNTLSTLPDYGARIIIQGKAPSGYGGVQGIRLTNTSIDPPLSITYTQPAYYGHMIIIDTATEAVRVNGLPFPSLVSIPRGQFDMFCIEAGIVNNIDVEILGATYGLNGYLDIDTKPKFA
jgi:hypothetical protein